MLEKLTDGGEALVSRAVTLAPMLAVALMPGERSNLYQKRSTQWIFRR